MAAEGTGTEAPGGGAGASAGRARKARAADGKTRPRRGRAGARTPRRSAPVKLPKDYRPAEDEPFMGPRQREYFRLKLMCWRREILAESRETIAHLQENSVPEADIADRASAESERLIELRTRDRARKLLGKIDAALRRIEDGSYGYCEETGEPIGLRRLEARPIATLSIDAQERHERLEKTYRDD